MIEGKASLQALAEVVVEVVDLVVVVEAEVDLVVVEEEAAVEEEGEVVVEILPARGIAVLLLSFRAIRSLSNFFKKKCRKHYFLCN